jgi:hypothetical protein
MQQDSAAPSIAAKGDRLPHRELLGLDQRRRIRLLQIRVIIGNPHRQAPGVAASGGPDPRQDDLDLIDPEFGGHRVAFGDHIRGRLPAPMR